MNAKSAILSFALLVVLSNCSSVYFFFILFALGGICFHFSVDKIILSDPKDPFYHAPVNKSLVIWLIFPFPSFLDLMFLISSIIFNVAYIFRSNMTNTLCSLSGLCVCCFLKERKCVVCDRAVIGWRPTQIWFVSFKACDCDIVNFVSALIDNNASFYLKIVMYHW